MYYMISANDGDIDVVELDKDDIAKAMADALDDDVTFLSSVPIPDPQYWPDNSSLIIKGEIVVPKPKTTITEYVVD